MKWWKRPFDIVAAVALIGIFGLPILVIALVLRLTSGSPILFRQERVGRFGRIFVCFKFRTMHRDADRWLDEILRFDHEARAEWLDHRKLGGDPRVTAVGRWLRRTSLDELPQLLNVLKGDMSLVGPRPVVPAETLRYGDAIAQVLQVKPGITGLWQVSGRSKLCYAERIELDLDYCRSSSMGQDIIICLKTVKHLLPLGDNGAC